MKQKIKVSVLGRIKKFFIQLFDKIDKKMQTEAKTNSCCKSGDGKDKSCCS